MWYEYASVHTSRESMETTKKGLFKIKEMNPMEDVKVSLLAVHQTSVNVKVKACHFGKCWNR